MQALILYVTFYLYLNYILKKVFIKLSKHCNIFDTFLLSVLKTTIQKCNGLKLQHWVPLVVSAQGVPNLAAIFVLS